MTFCHSCTCILGTDQFLNEHPQLIEQCIQSDQPEKPSACKKKYWTEIKATSLELWTCVCVPTMLSH